MAVLVGLRALEAVSDLARGNKILVFFSEGPEYWPHFRDVLHELLFVHRCPLIYIASTNDDPGLQIRHPLVRTYCIGQGGPRVNLFKNLAADIMVLTMPDLAQLSLARSPACGNYVYLFHSPVSTHMVYRNGAFDHYDTIFCVGPHHEAEIRQREKMAGLPAKRLFQHGYDRLDDITAEVARRAKAPAAQRSTGAGAQVLLAPSWGPTGILETSGEAVVQGLLDAGHSVVVRPHPQTTRLARPVIDGLTARFGTHAGFRLETDMASRDSFFESDVLISDWSGTSFEFAFSRLRPVVFLDVARKVKNPDWASLDIEPLEAKLRERLGIVVAPQDIGGLVSAVTSAIASADDFRQNILAERKKWIFNSGHGSRVAAHELARLAFNAALGDEGKPEDLESRCVSLALAMLGSVDSTAKPGSLAAFLARLLAAKGQFASEDLAGLEALCRRIDVFKKLHRDYDAAFLKPLPQSPLAEPAIFPALAFLFIQAASLLDEVQSGLAVKFLNSAANVLNLYAASGPAQGIIAFESLMARATDQVMERSP